ncbi:ribosomal protein S16 [Violaceomyces palustris]|uniref:Ribosomal protein S16 n=1 Tax=Violaceomyces palustris TaxID=1673888 RepID=A0ACD0P258_9BASI|nr:ribosomal protein S16 [Violaceomyces palustris]
MVVRLRLARHGTKNNPFYHIVAINDSKPRDARPIEKLGEYDPIPRPVSIPRVATLPHTNRKGKGKEVSSSPSSSSSQVREGYGKVMTSGLNVETAMQKRIEWNEERITFWLKSGAQPSKPVARLLDRAGLIPEGKHYKGIYRPPTTTTTSSSASSSQHQDPSSNPSKILEAVSATSKPSQVSQQKEAGEADPNSSL